MTIDRAIEILNPEHREHYESIDPVVEACRMGMEALERTRWIPCSERLPDSSGKFLCCCDGEVRTLKYWRTCQEFQYGGKKRNVTHWMPLPEPPEEGEAGNGK